MGITGKLNTFNMKNKGDFVNWVQRSPELLWTRASGCRYRFSLSAQPRIYWGRFNL